MRLFRLSSLFICFLITALFFTACKDEPDAPGAAGTNTPPAGTAGTGITVLVGETVTFNGTAEDADPDSSLTYLWSITSTPAGSSVTNASITNAATLNASFIPDIPGDYTVSITIDDGTASVTADASVRAVGYAIGLNIPGISTSAGYIHNGDLIQLDSPDSAEGGHYVRDMIINNGIVYNCGAFVYYVNPAAPGLYDYQPVYWTGLIDTEVTLPSGSSSSEADTLTVDSNNRVQLVVKPVGGSTYDFWAEGDPYPATPITASPAWENYSVTGLFKSGNDVFQIGTANDTGGPLTFFMAKNRSEIVHSTTYTPDPFSNVDIKGALFVRDNTNDTSSKVYLYGNYMDGSDEIQAGYEVNGGSGWVTLYHNSTYPYNSDQYVSYMASPDDYIINALDENGEYKTVYVNGIEAAMETPHDGEALVTISNLDYVYMEEIGGSVFVLGGFTYQYYEDPAYNVAAVWRDGIIVREEYDDDPDDSVDLTSASIAAGDFE